MNCWDILQIEATSDVVAIKRAYAARLKVTRPDGDAVAYQELRQAYEAALQMRHWLTVAQETMVDTVVSEARATEAVTDVVELAGPILVSEPAEQQVAQSDADRSDEPPVEELDPESLTQLIAKQWAGFGNDWLLEQWSSIEQSLHAMPLAWRDRSSIAWANFVVDNQELPDAFVSTLAKYFQWGADFRSESRMGPVLAQKLRERFAVVVDLANISRETRKKYEWHLAIASALDRGKKWLAIAIAFLMPRAIVSLFDAEGALVLKAFGFGRERIAQVQSMANKAYQWQIVVPIVLLYWTVEWARQSHVRQGEPHIHWMLCFMLFVPITLLAAGGGQRLSELSQRFVFNEKLDPKLHFVAYLLPWVLAACSFSERLVNWATSMVPGEWLVVQIAIVYLACLLINWPRKQKWEVVVVPALIVMVVEIYAAYPSLNPVVVMSMATASVMHSSALLKKYPFTLSDYVQVIRGYEIRPLHTLRIALFLLLGIKLVVLLVALAFIALAPFVAFKIAKNHSVVRAFLAIGSAITLGICVGSPNSLSYVCAWLMLCNVVLLALQYVATKFGKLLFKFA